jgi:hypothetical protein
MQRPGGQVRQKLMNTTSKTAIATALILFGPLAMACDYPKRPKIPNGGTATKEEMVAANKAVKTYQAALQEYRSCIDAEETDAVAKLENPSEEELDKRKSAIAKKYNASVDEEMIVVAEFNEAVGAWRARSD